jgi:hypothetical protein
MMAKIKGKGVTLTGTRSAARMKGSTRVGLDPPPSPPKLTMGEVPPSQSTPPNGGVTACSLNSLPTLREPPATIASAASSALVHLPLNHGSIEPREETTCSLPKKRNESIRGAVCELNE